MFENKWSEIDDGGGETRKSLDVVVGVGWGKLLNNQVQYLRKQAGEMFVFGHSYHGVQCPATCDVIFKMRAALQRVTTCLFFF